MFRKRIGKNYFILIIGRGKNYFILKIRRGKIITYLKMWASMCFHSFINKFKTILNFFNFRWEFRKTKEFQSWKMNMKNWEFQLKIPLTVRTSKFKLIIQWFWSMNPLSFLSKKSSQKNRMLKSSLNLLKFI